MRQIARGCEATPGIFKEFPQPKRGLRPMGPEHRTSSVKISDGRDLFRVGRKNANPQGIKAAPDF